MTISTMASPESTFPRRSYCKGSNGFAGVGMQQTSDEDFRRQILRVLKMYASVPVDSRMLVQKRTLRKCLVYSGLPEVLRPDDWQYTLKQCKVVVEEIAAGIDQFEFRRKVGKKNAFRSRNA